jgi:hypothetical protein
MTSAVLALPSHVALIWTGTATAILLWELLTLRMRCSSGKIGESYSANALVFRWNWWILICARAAPLVGRRDHTLRSANALLFRCKWVADLTLHRRCKSDGAGGQILPCACDALSLEKLEDLTLRMRCSSDRQGRRMTVDLTLRMSCFSDREGLRILLCACPAPQVKWVDLTLLMRLSFGGIDGS